MHRMFKISTPPPPGRCQSSRYPPLPCDRRIYRKILSACCSFALPRKSEMAVRSAVAMDQTSSGVWRPIPCPHVSCLMTLLNSQMVNHSFSPVYGMTFRTVVKSSPNISRHMVLKRKVNLFIQSKSANYVTEYLCMYVYAEVDLNYKSIFYAVLVFLVGFFCKSRS